MIETVNHGPLILSSDSAGDAHADVPQADGRGRVGRNFHRRQSRKHTSPSQVRASVVPDTEQATIVPEIVRNVDPAAVVCTDASSSYAGLMVRFIHKAIDHATAYVRGLVHVNGIENFWSLVKRMLRGTYVAVAPFHLQAYLDEEVFRFNERKDDDGGRFAKVMRCVLGKRITLRVLCAIDDAGFMGIA